MTGEFIAGFFTCVIAVVALYASGFLTIAFHKRDAVEDVRTGVAKGKAAAKLQRR